MQVARSAALAAFVAVMAAPGVARAGEPTLQLAWVRGPGAEGCPTSDAVRAAVAARTGRDPFTLSGERSFEVVITRAGDTWVGSFLDRAADGTVLGERRLETRSADCESISLALVLSLSLSVSSILPPTAPVPSSTVAPPPPAPPPAPTEPPPRAPSAPVAPAGPRLARGAFALSPIAAAGLLPDIAFGVSSDVQLALGRFFALGSSFAYFPEVRRGGFGFGLTAIALEGCAGAPWGRLTVEGCVGVWLGAIHSVVYQAFPTAPGDRPWVAVDVAPRARLRIVGPLDLVVGLHVLVSATQYGFTVAGQPDSAYEQSRVGGAAEIGIGAEIP